MKDQIAKYSKALLAILGGVATVLGIWGLEVPLTQEQAAGLATGAATLLVIFGPKNKE